MSDSQPARSSDERSETGETSKPPPKMRPPPALVSATGAGLLVATFYPLLAERTLAAVGVRGVAFTLIGLGVASIVIWRRALRRLSSRAGLPLGLHAALLALPALAVLTDDELPLHLVPSLIQLLISAFFALSLGSGSSILEQTAKRIHPYAPDFIGPYCRKATAVFAAIFALQGIAIAVLALRMPTGEAAGEGAAGWSWGATAGVLAWAPVMAASLVEWAVRKSWFRYYTDGPVDRLLRRVLPPENTEAGRRSLAYIRHMRTQLGMPPP